MVNDNYTNQQRTCYFKGDYIEFLNNYKAPEYKAYDDSVHFYATLVLHEMGEWNKILEILKFLKDNGKDKSKTKAELYLKYYDFFLNQQSRGIAKKIIEENRKNTSFFDNPEISCFTKKIEILIKTTLLILGLESIDEKEQIIFDGLQLYEHYKSIDLEEATKLLFILANLSMSMPQPNAKNALKIISEYLDEKNLEQTDKLLLVQFYNLEARAILNSQYYNREEIEPQKMPKVLIEIAKKYEKTGHVCGNEILCGIYGTHLLELELTEGIEWLDKSVQKIWDFGHKNTALNNKNTAIKWAEDKGYPNLTNELKKKFGFVKKDLNASFEKDIEQLNTAVKYYSEGDYEAGKKLLQETILTSKSETNKVHLISLMVNNSQKIQTNVNDLIEEIDNLTYSLDGINKSILLAQLYFLKTLLINDPDSDDYEKAIDLYTETGSIEDAIEQLLNRFFLRVEKRKKLNLKPFISNEVIQDLEKAEGLLSENRLIKNKNYLTGKLYQIAANTLLLDNRATEALERLKQAAIHFSKANNLRQYAINSHHLSSSLISNGRSSGIQAYYDDAIEHLKPALNVLEQSNLVDFLWRLEFNMALALYEPIQKKYLTEDANRKERIEEAEKYYMKALNTFNLLFRKNRTLKTSERIFAASALNKDIRQLSFSGYYFFHDNKKWEKCIYWLENIRAKSLNASLASSTKPSNLYRDNILLKDEESIRKKISNSTSIKQQRTQEIKLKDLYNQMANDINLNDYANKKQATIPEYRTVLKGIQDEVKLLKRNIIFVYYYTHLNNIYCFGIHPNKISPLYSKIDLADNDLEKELKKTYRLNLKTYNIFKPKEKFWTKYSALIEPLNNWTEPGDVICIIPFGFLHDLPYHALLINDKSLIARNPVFYNTSLTSWEYIRNTNNITPPFKHPAIFGNPEENLMESLKESHYISELLHVKPFVGKEVSQNQFFASLENASLLHFAGHGYFETSNGLQSAIKLNLGEIITAEKLMNTSINTNLVVLSACETGLHRNYPGEESAGLISALISAGAKSVIASLWTINDRDAKDFFTLFYYKLKKGLPKVIAMQETMIELMNRKNYNHFFHWGGFMLQGYYK